MRIVVGVDAGQESSGALALADHLAAGPEAHLVVAHVYPRHRGDVRFGPAQTALLEERSREIVDDARRRLARRSEALVYGAPSVARGLMAVCETEEFELLVLGASHRGPLERTLLGTVADQVVHGSSCAVAVAPTGYSAADAPIRSIGVGYDGQAESRAALAWAAGLAQRCDARITVHTALEPLALLPYPNAVFSSELHAEHAARQQRLLRQALADLPADLEATSAFVEGDPAEALQAASHHHDLLVVGSRGYGTVGTVLLGGVSRKVLRHAACPVVVLPRSAMADASEAVPPAEAALT